MSMTDASPCIRTDVSAGPRRPTPQATACGNLTLDVSAMYQFGEHRAVLACPASIKSVPASSLLGDYIRARIGTDWYTPLPPFFGFGSRRPGVRISPSRPHLPAAVADVSSSRRVDVSQMYQPFGRLPARNCSMVLTSCAELGGLRYRNPRHGRGTVLPWLRNASC
jgi:hypothetical protein